MSQWSFHHRLAECKACSRPFQDGERHPSGLRFEAGELCRDDFCDGCWPESEGDMLIWWYTHHRTAPQKRTLKLDLEALETLFLKLAEVDTEPARELRYLLCLLLMRKRRLKLERVRRGRDGESLVVRRPRRKDAHDVPVFDFEPARIEALRGRLQEIFEGVDSESGVDLSDLDRAIADEPPDDQVDGDQVDGDQVDGDQVDGEPGETAPEGDPGEPTPEADASQTESGEVNRA